MTTDKQIELIDELADKCCRDHDLHANHKSCMGCWRRTDGCDKYILLNKLVEEGCRLERQGRWLFSNYGGIHYYQCSCCDAEFERPLTYTKDDVKKYRKYCSACGARMIKE